LGHSRPFVTHRNRRHPTLDRALDDDPTAPGAPPESVQQHVGEHLRGVRGKRQPDHRTARRHREHDPRALRFDREGFNGGFDDGVERFFVLVDGALSSDGPSRGVARTARAMLYNRERAIQLLRGGAPRASLSDPTE
jgi:hypothetical protein